MGHICALFIFLCYIIHNCFGQYCSEIFENVVTSSEREFIVNKHNEIRKLIANGQVEGLPRGVNLKKLQWDNTIAQAAQNITETCNFEVQTLYDARWGVGQNYFLFQSSHFQFGADWESTIQNWFDERNSYTFKPFDGEFGRFTQLVWADTQYVGCGYTNFEGYDHELTYNKFYLCAYGPNGNFEGEEPYETGTSGCEDLC